MVELTRCDTAVVTNQAARCSPVVFLIPVSHALDRAAGLKLIYGLLAADTGAHLAATGKTRRKGSGHRASIGLSLAVSLDPPSEFAAQWLEDLLLCSDGRRASAGSSPGLRGGCRTKLAGLGFGAARSATFAPDRLGRPAWPLVAVLQAAMVAVWWRWSLVRL